MKNNNNIKENNTDIKDALKGNEDEILKAKMQLISCIILIILVIVLVAMMEYNYKSMIINPAMETAITIVSTILGVFALLAAAILD